MGVRAALTWTLGMLCLIATSAVHLAEQGQLEVDVSEGLCAQAASKSRAQAASKALVAAEEQNKMLPLGEGVMIYHFMVIVSPDDPKAGTQDGINVMLTGSLSAMKDAVPMAAGFSVGQVADLNVVTSSVGSVTSMKLLMTEAVDDDVLLEFVSIDERYGLPEDGTVRYTNFCNEQETFIAKNKPLTLLPSSDYIVIVRTSSFIHAGTKNAVSIRFIGEDGSSEVLLLSAKGFARATSNAINLKSTYPFVNNVKQIELSILFKSDDLWMPDSFQLFSPYQRTSFHNAETQFIGYKPYVIGSDTLKKQMIKEGKSAH